MARKTMIDPMNHVIARRTPVHVRRVVPSDAPVLSAFYADLSPASRRLRFLGSAAGVAPDGTRQFCTPDHHHAEGFIAVARDRPTEPGLIVGHLCLVPDAERGVELAVVVADEHQRRGIARRLLGAALRWARRNGIAVVRATAFADNIAVLRLLGSAPGAHQRPVGSGLVEVEIPVVQEGGLSRSTRACAWPRRRQPGRGAGD